VFLGDDRGAEKFVIKEKVSEEDGKEDFPIINLSVETSAQEESTKNELTT